MGFSGSNLNCDEIKEMSAMSKVQLDLKEDNVSLIYSEGN